MSGRCLQGVGKVSDWCLLGIKRVSGGYKEGLDGCLGQKIFLDQDLFLDPNFFLPNFFLSYDLFQLKSFPNLKLFCILDLFDPENLKPKFF